MKELLRQILENQVKIVGLLNKTLEDNKESRESFDEKLSNILSTSISMLHLSEQSMEDITKRLEEIRGVQGLTTVEANQLMSPLQEMIFQRIFEIISIEADESITTIRDDFIVHTTERFGLIRHLENIASRKEKEHLLMQYFYYLSNRYQLSVMSSVFILGLLDVYLMVTTSEQRDRMNGTFRVVKQIFLNSQDRDVRRLSDTVPTVKL